MCVKILIRWDNCLRVLFTKHINNGTTRLGTFVVWFKKTTWVTISDHAHRRSDLPTEHHRLIPPPCRLHFELMGVSCTKTQHLSLLLNSLDKSTIFACIPHIQSTQDELLDIAGALHIFDLAEDTRSKDQRFL